MVQSAVPMLETQVYYESPLTKETETLMVLGIDLLKESQVRSYQSNDHQIIEDPLIFLNQPDSIILTKKFAEANHLEMNSKVSLSTASGLKTFTVRGLLDPSGPAKAYGGNIAIMDIDGAQVMFGKVGKLDRIDIVPRPNIKVGDARLALEKEFNPEFQVESPASQSENMRVLVQGYQGLLSLIGLISLLVGLFLVLNTMGISIHERRRDFGVLRAVGATKWIVFGMIVCEAMILGLIGSACGLLLGKWVAQFMVGMITTALSTQYMMPVFIDHLTLTSLHWFKAIGLGTFCSVIAGAIAAKSTLAVQPLEAVRKTETPPKTASYTQPIVGFVLLTLTGFNLIPVLNPFFLIIGSIMISPFFVRLMIQGVHLMFSRPTVKLATGNLLQNASRTGSNIMTLMVGLILVIIISLLNASIKNSLVSWFDKTLAADLIVSSNGKLMTFQVQPLHEDLTQKINSLAGVDIESGIGATGMRYVKQNYQGKVLALKAFDPPHPRLRASQFDLKEGNNDTAVTEFFSSGLNNTQYTVMVSQNFKMHFHSSLGDSIELNTPTGVHVFKIIGVISEFTNPEGVFYVNRETFKKLWKDSLITGFFVMVKPGVLPETVRAELDHAFGKSLGVMATLNQDLAVQARSLIEDNFAYTKAIEWSAILVGLFGLLNTLMVSILDRTRDFGVLRAVGMTRSELMSMIMTESFLQGFLGALVAVICGVCVSYFWVIGTVSQLMGFVLQFYLSWAVVLKTLGFGLGVGIIAGFFPARFASRLQIIECLQRNE